MASDWKSFVYARHGRELIGCDSTVFDPAFDMSSLRSELRVEDRPNVAQTEGGQGKHERLNVFLFRAFPGPDLAHRLSRWLIRARSARAGNLSCFRDNSFFASLTINPISNRTGWKVLYSILAIQHATRTLQRLWKSEYWNLNVQNSKQNRSCAVAFRFGHWYFRHLNLFRVSIFEFRISPSLTGGLYGNIHPAFHLAVPKCKITETGTMLTFGP